MSNESLLRSPEFTADYEKIRELKEFSNEVYCVDQSGQLPFRVYKISAGEFSRDGSILLSDSYKESLSVLDIDTTDTKPDNKRWCTNLSEALVAVQNLRQSKLKECEKILSNPNVFDEEKLDVEIRRDEILQNKILEMRTLSEEALSATGDLAGFDYDIGALADGNINASGKEVEAYHNKILETVLTQMNDSIFADYDRLTLLMQHPKYKTLHGDVRAEIYEITKSIEKTHFSAVNLNKTDSKKKFENVTKYLQISEDYITRLEKLFHTLGPLLETNGIVFEEEVPPPKGYSEMTPDEIFENLPPKFEMKTFSLEEVLEMYFPGQYVMRKDVPYFVSTEQNYVEMALDNGRFMENTYISSVRWNEELRKFEVACYDMSIDRLVGDQPRYKVQLDAYNDVRGGSHLGSILAGLGADKNKQNEIKKYLDDYNKQRADEHNKKIFDIVGRLLSLPEAKCLPARVVYKGIDEVLVYEHFNNPHIGKQFAYDTLSVATIPQRFIDDWREAEALYDRYKKGEIDVNVVVRDVEAGRENLTRAWVIKPDGSLKPFDIDENDLWFQRKGWRIVESSDLLVWWEKDHPRLPHEFKSQRPKKSSITPEQVATVRRLEQEVIERYAAHDENGKLTETCRGWREISNV